MKTRNLLIACILGITISATAQNYQVAAGLKLAWGWGLTGKFFIKDKNAIEGILNYRSYGYVGGDYNYIRITGLYEVHKDLSSTAKGLMWYYGGGAFLGSYGGHFTDYYTGTESKTYIGIAGCLGLDYKFDDAPINLSVDWIPSIVLSGYGNGFTGEAGGIAVRYTFK